MRISRISVLHFLALPLAAVVLAHDVQGRAGGQAHNLGRHNEAEYMRRQILGGIIGGGDDDSTTSSAAAATSSKTSAAATSTSGGITLVPPPSSTGSTTSAPSSSGASSGISTGLSTTASISGSLSANTTSTNTSIAIPSTSAPASSQAQSTSASIDAQGQTIMVTVYASASTSSAASIADAAQTSAPASNASPAISTPAIVGISVAAGVVILSLIGCAVWRMKRRSGDEDEAIRWPELNRHGDSDAHHALPARQTGQHGIETSPLERSLSNSSSIFASSLSRGPSTHMTSTAVPLNGSNFGAANSLDYYEEKNVYPSGATYDAYDNSYPLPNPHGGQDDMYATGPQMMEDYSSMPPPMQHAHSPHGALVPGYSSEEEEMGGIGAGAAGVGARHGAYRG